jgi:5-methyltetrahydropteroyltriglutamate--homocysteine methyltransferase
MTIATSVSHYPKVGDRPGQQLLRQAIARVDRGEEEPAAIARAEETMTVAAIEEQEAAGLDLVTDGQIRWHDPITYLARGLEGFTITGLVRWFESNTYFRQPRVAGDVAWTRPVLADDLVFAQRHSGRPVKAVVTGPYTIATLSEGAGRDHRHLTLSLARALNRELRALASLKPAWIQIDEPAIARNPSVRYRRDLSLFEEAMRTLVDGVPGRLSLYVYHGDLADAPGLLELPFALIGLDFVQGEANWELLDRWPSGKGLGLGLIDARNVRMEDPRALADAIASARGAIGDGEIHVSPSCGLEFLPRDVARRKLELTARAAHERREAVV